MDVSGELEHPKTGGARRQLRIFGVTPYLSRPDLLSGPDRKPSTSSPEVYQTQGLRYLEAVSVTSSHGCPATNIVCSTLKVARLAGLNSPRPSRSG